MCTRYISPETREIEAYWHIGARTRSGPLQSPRNLFPLATGPFLRSSADDGLRELAWGQWGMIPRDSETRIPMSRPRGPGEKPKRLSTVNARTESVTSRPTFSGAWRAGQRCIVPASSFYEPNWESGKNVWWQFRRADGAPWGAAGLWSRWTDPESGETVDSYTMLTINANAHPLMNRMHKPEADPKTRMLLPPEKQDKRSLVLIEREDVDRWLQGTLDEAKGLLVLTPVKRFLAGPHAIDERAVTPQQGTGGACLHAFGQHGYSRGPERTNTYAIFIAYVSRRIIKPDNQSGGVVDLLERAQLMVERAHLRVAT